MRHALRPLYKKLVRRQLLNGVAAIRRRVALPHVTFIGVTGSCGKSTTIALSDAILSSAGECRIGAGASRTLVAESINGLGTSTTFCVQELHASFPGIIAESLWVSKPQIGVVTIIGGDHYKSYRSLEATAREKGRLVESLPPNGVAILNIDSPLVLGMAKRTCARVMTFGLSPQADVRASEVSSLWPDRLSMQVTYLGETVRVETKLVGEHWTVSVLAAIASGIACGLDLKSCARAVKAVEPVFGRCSVHVRSDGACYVLDTYKAPYWTIAEGLALVRNARAPRKTVVLGTISDYPGAVSSRYRRVARDALDVADRVVFVGPRSGHIDKLRAGDVRGRLFGFQTNYQASAFLAADAIPGELIYVKGPIAEHLERLMLSQLEEVVCWRERCGRISSPCTECPKYRVAKMPPLGLMQASATTETALT
jgi:UDP-N-acetylmuramoyl-tripeptide--D-alanyl-D-alanine ligase